MEKYETTIRFLPAQEVRFFRTASGRLAASVGAEQFDEVKLTRAFPHTDPERFISVADGDGKEIGVVEDMAELPPESAAAAQEELELTYFSPEVRRITRVVQHYGASSWQVETDRGPQLVRVRERGDIRWLGASRVVLTDVNGIRYEISDLGALDDDSRTLLEQET